MKTLHFVLVYYLEGLENSVIWLTDHPDTTIAVYHGSKAITQQQQCKYVFLPIAVLQNEYFDKKY
ncbi:MAG: hypothetical protein AB2693_26205 [Candidatus Thiodiazotropha sp.]